jgi:hypothetical protein
MVTGDGTGDAVAADGADAVDAEEVTAIVKALDF